MRHSRTRTTLTVTTGDGRSVGFTVTSAWPMPAGVTRRMFRRIRVALYPGGYVLLGLDRVGHTSRLIVSRRPVPRRPRPARRRWAR